MENQVYVFSLDDFGGFPGFSLRGTVTVSGAPDIVTIFDDDPLFQEAPGYFTNSPNTGEQQRVVGPFILDGVEYDGTGIWSQARATLENITTGETGAVFWVADSSGSDQVGYVTTIPVWLGDQITVAGDSTFSDDSVAYALLFGPDSDHVIVRNDTLFGDGFQAAYDLDLGRTVYRLYQATLGREPDARGLTDWTEQLALGFNTLIGVAAGIVDSPEFVNAHETLDDAGFVTLLYQNVLGADPDPRGLAGWVTALEAGQSRVEVLLDFAQSAEFIDATNAAATEFTLARDPAFWQGDVYRLYQATLGREPDQAGFQGWLDALSEGMPILEVINGFVRSLEFQNTYGDQDNTAFVTLLYQNMLGRDADADGFAEWVAQLDSGVSRPEIVGDFAQSAEFINATTPGLRDWIRAQGVDDVLDGGAGTNELWGGPMADVFRFQQSDAGTHRVQDLEPWDFLEFRGFGFSEPQDALMQMTQQGADVVFEDQGTSVILANTQLAALDADAFLFA